MSKRARDTSPEETTSAAYDPTHVIVNGVHRDNDKGDHAGIITRERFDALIRANAATMHFDDADTLFDHADLTQTQVLKEMEHLLEWKLRLSKRGPDYAAFADAFYHSVRWVRWNDFLREMRAAAAETAQRLAKERRSAPRGIHVLMVDTSRLDKSNMWLSGLLWPVLREQIDFVVHRWVDVVRIYSYFRWLSSDRPPLVHVAYVDDMVYSGNQLCGIAFNKGPEANLQHNASAARLTSDVAQGRVANPRFFAHYHFIVPYVTPIAYERIEEWATHVDFPSNVHVIGALNEYTHASVTALLEHPELTEKERTALALVSSSNDPMIVFQHKIADGTSLTLSLVYGNANLFGLPPLTNFAADKTQQPFYRRLKWRTSDGATVIHDASDFHAHFSACAALEPYACLTCGARSGATADDHGTCGSCLEAVYCSATCQEADWTHHALLCGQKTNSS